MKLYPYNLLLLIIFALNSGLSGINFLLKWENYEFQVLPM